MNRTQNDLYLDYLEDVVMPTAWNPRKKRRPLGRLPALIGLGVVIFGVWAVLAIGKV